MTRALDLITLDDAAGELTAIVRTDILDRVVRAVDVEDDDGRAVGIDDLEAAGRELAFARDIDPVRQR